jgi:hypothetical protein
LRQTRLDPQAVPLSEAQQEFGIRSLVEQQVGRQFQQFEIELLQNFQRITEHIARENARALAQHFENRIQTLESISARQSAVLARLSAPGQLAWAPAPGAAEVEAGTRPDSADAAAEPGRPSAIEYPSLHCPRCTSRHIRRASRANFFEQLLRVLGFAPFRCRSCRHKFYRVHRHPRGI